MPVHLRRHNYQLLLKAIEKEAKMIEKAKQKAPSGRRTVRKK